MVAGIGTFIATRHPILSFEVGKATLVALGGAAAGGLIGTGGAVATEWVTEENKNETFESASCGRSINVVITNKGRTFMWGRGEYFKNKFDDFRGFSWPF